MCPLHEWGKNILEGAEKGLQHRQIFTSEDLRGISKWILNSSKITNLKDLDVKSDISSPKLGDKSMARHKKDDMPHSACLTVSKVLRGYLGIYRRWPQMYTKWWATLFIWIFKLRDTEDNLLLQWLIFLQASASFSSALSNSPVCHQETMLMAWCGFCREETPQIHIMFPKAHGKGSAKKLLENDQQMANSLPLSMDRAGCPTAYTPVLELR